MASRECRGMAKGTSLRAAHATAVLLRGALLAAGLAGLAACGGGDGPTQVKNCTTDPTLPQCQHDTTPTPVATTLKSEAEKHGLSVGAALDALFQQTSSAKYDSLVAAEFNMVVAGNFMKWGVLNRDSRFGYRWTWGDSLVAFAQKNGMKVRGHTLAWHNQNPTWLTSGQWSADTLRQLLKEHIDSVLTHWKGKVYAWDVINEALNDGDGTLRSTIWSNALGAAYIDSAFAWARRADPGTLLFYNDYNLETPGTKQDSAYALVQRLKAQGHIDGIGFQAHLLVNSDGTGAPTRQQLIDTFNRFAALGVKIHLTELDVRVPDGAGQTVLDKQAQVYGDVATACRTVSACEAIVVWGVLDSESWIPSTFSGWGRALLWDGNYVKKATYASFLAGLKS